MIQEIYEFFENLVFPELRPFDRKTRDNLLRDARDTPFDWIEWAGIAFAVGLVAILTRYRLGDVGVLGRIAVAAVNFLVAAAALGVLAGPFLLRRTKRGLRSRLH